MEDIISKETKELIIAAMEKMFKILNEGDDLEDWQKRDIRNHYYKEFLDERRTRKKNEGEL